MSKIVKYLKMSVLAAIIICLFIGVTILLTSSKYGISSLSDSEVVASDLSNSQIDIHHNFVIDDNPVTKGETQISVNRPNDSGIDVFRGSFLVPLDGNLTGLHSQNGVIESTKLGDNRYTYTLDLNDSTSQFSLVYTYKFESLLMEHTERLKTHRITTGLKGEQSLKLHSDSYVNSVVEDGNYEAKIENDEISIESDERIDIQVVVGRPDYTIDGISVFDEQQVMIEHINPSDLRSIQNIASKIMGFEAPDRHPIVFQSDEKFENRSGYSVQRVGGLYEAGVSKIPASTFDRNQGLSVTAHEFAHSKNDQVGEFPRWFDEGSAMYLQTAVARQYNELYVPPFAQDYQYPQNCVDRQIEGCKLYSSSSSYDDLETYLENPNLGDNWSRNTFFKYEINDLYLKYAVGSRMEQDSLRGFYRKIIENGSKGDEINTDLLLEVPNDNSIYPCKDSNSNTEDLKNCVDKYGDYSPSTDSMITDVLQL